MFKVHILVRAMPQMLLSTFTQESSHLHQPADSKQVAYAI